MKSISITGELRTDLGKKASKALRNEGHVPCVIYGGENPVHVHMDSRKFKNLVNTPNTYLIELKAGEKTFKVILKDIDFHPTTDEVVHADFFEVNETAPFEVSIPVKLTGTSPGVLNGGVLSIKKRKVRVKGLLKDIPEAVTVDITPLKIGMARKIKDATIENVTFLAPADDVIVAVKNSRKAVATEGDEEEAEVTETEAAAAE